ncbi:MAG: UDP-glucose/GDP-mannose dehydrogenase family protein [Planctomycetota bacterium]
MRVCVIGTGYVGLVAATCFAESGNTVIAVDVDKEKINKLRRGEIPIYEPGLEELVRKNVDNERLSFSTDTAEAVRASEIIFIAVGTPPGEDGSADLKHVLAAAREIGRAANGPKVVVNKSTVPVGTARKVAAVLAEMTSYPMQVVSNPEFLKEGAAIDDFMKPDRVVIGCDDPKTAEVMHVLYEPFVRTGNPIILMDVASAELTKYAANAMLATRISFMNQVALLCEAVGADVNKVRQGIGTDRRIGHSFLFAGCGYGGSCFPKDSRAIIKTAEEHGIDFLIMKAVEDVNDQMKRLLAVKVKRHFGEDLTGRTIAIWGLAFKPRTDDMREASSITIIEELLAAGAKVRTRDPEAVQEAAKIFGDRITYHQTPYRALDGADALVVVTEWNEFRNPDFDRMKELMKTPLIFDGRNIFPAHILEEKGFTYYPIGGPPVGPLAVHSQRVGSRGK